ncbi:hypothetical protein Gpo141_00008434 [Globisporangium polare]
MRATISRVAKTKTATVASEKKSSNASVSKKAPATQHIQWRGKRITLFESRVYELISTIPEGKVSTYGGVAKALDSGPRPVGQALRKNPFAPQVPCHRVVAACLSIGGFKGSVGEDTAHICEKRELLTKEGVTFTQELKVEGSCLHSFE